MRRRLEKDHTLLIEKPCQGQQPLVFIEEAEDFKLFEYAVLITALDSEVVSIVQHYRDRADCETVFDEIKNQWDWGGYTTHDSKSCRFMARMIGLIDNGWRLFVRLINPEGQGHQEAITSRPLLLTSVGRLTQSGRQKRMTMTSHHGKSEKIRALFLQANDFLIN